MSALAGIPSIRASCLVVRPSSATRGLACPSGCRRHWAAALAVLPILLGCGSGDTPSERWRGAIDTLPSGQIRVANTADGMWTDSDAWRVVEDLRLGTQQEDAPDLFGNVAALAVDAEGRIWVLDDRALEIRIFDRDGRYVRTVGQEGGGPGEFRAPQAIHRAPDGRMWVPDPRNNRLSVLDTTGAYVEGMYMPGGFGTSRWPGGFDRAGYYYLPIRTFDGAGGLALVRFTTAHAVVDTLQVPTDPKEREVFELRRGAMRAELDVPFAGHFEWRLAPSGNLWGMLTDDYRLYEFSSEGDTLRTVTRAFTPLPVADAEMEAKRSELEPFIQAGGKVDWSKIPRTKPATARFFIDDESDLWVVPEAAPEAEGRMLDVFAPDGRFLGTVRLPFVPAMAPLPLIRNSTLYCVTKDSLGVPYVVRAKIVKP
jgi:sugar lactone lactonase YvrE